MELVCEEVKKCFLSRRNLVIMILVLIFHGFFMITSYNDWASDISDLGAYNLYADSWNGKIDFSMITDDEWKALENEKYSSLGNTIHDIWKEDYLYSASRSRRWLEYYGDNPTSYIGIKKYVEKMRKDGKEDTYEYRKYVKWLNMLENTGQPEYSNSVGINQLVQNVSDVITPIMVGVPLIFFIIPIFGEDYHSGMESVILASKKGRKNILNAKIISTYFYTLFWVTLHYFSLVILNIILYQNTTVLKAPINSIACLSRCPFDMAVWQYLLVGYLMNLLGGMALSSIFCYISSRIRDSIIAVGCCIVVVFLPMIVPKNGSLGLLFCLLPSISMQSNKLFGSYLVLNIFQEPVLLGYLSVITLILISVLFVLGVKMKYRKRINLL